jgi:hypothetical protein
MNDDGTWLGFYENENETDWTNKPWETGRKDGTGRDGTGRTKHMQARLD